MAKTLAFQSLPLPLGLPGWILSFFSPAHSLTEGDATKTKLEVPENQIKLHLLSSVSIHLSYSLPRQIACLTVCKLSIFLRWCETRLDNKSRLDKRHIPAGVAQARAIYYFLKNFFSFPWNTFWFSSFWLNPYLTLYKLYNLLCFTTPEYSIESNNQAVPCLPNKFEN